MIHCIGNSHTHYFSESTNIVGQECHKQHPYFRSYSLGPIIAYNFYEHHLENTKYIIKNVINPSKEDYIMLVNPEIDCRWHLPKKIVEAKLSMEYVVNECLERYFRTFTHLKENGVNLIVFGSHPSTTGGHNNDYPNNPVYGDCLSRNKITKYFNSELEKLCIKNNIHYLDIFDYLVDAESGLTKMEYFRDYCHLNFVSHPYMVEQFKNKGFIK